MACIGDVEEFIAVLQFTTVLNLVLVPFVSERWISMISGYVDLEARKRNLDREYRSEINWPMNRI